MANQVVTGAGFPWFRKSLRSLTSVAHARTSWSHTRLHNVRAHTLNILWHTAHLCSDFCLHFAHCHEPAGTAAKNTAGTAAELRPQKNKSKKRDFRKTQGAVGGRRVHVGKVKYRDQHRAEQTRFALHVQLCSSPSEPGSWQWAKCKQKTEHKCAVCHSIFNGVTSYTQVLQPRSLRSQS